MEACGLWVISMALMVPIVAFLTAIFNNLLHSSFPTVLALIGPAFVITRQVIVQKRASTSDSKRVHQEKKPSDPVPEWVHEELTQTKKYIESLEELLQRYGPLIENTGTVCLQALREIYKEQKAHLKQYNNFRKQYSDQFGFVVNILESHKKDIEEISRASTGNNASLCSIIGQYRKIIEDNQKLVRTHIETAFAALNVKDKAMESNQEQVNSRCDSIQKTLQSHKQLIEHNGKLIQEHGTSLDKVLSDHADLVAEYQTALDGLALFIAANHIISLIDKPSGWETLGNATQEVDDDVLVDGPRTQLAQEREKLTKGRGPGVAPPSMIENVHELARAFGRTSNVTIKAVDEKPEGIRTGASPFSRDNDAMFGEYHPNWESHSGMDQVMATIYGQIQDTVQAAVKATVDAQHIEEMKQLRKAQEDIEQLRANLGEIQEYRQLIRNRQELDKQNKRLTEIDNIIKNDPERWNRDEVFREEVNNFCREALEKNQKIREM